MLKRFCVLLVLCVGVSSFSMASAAEPTPADQLTAALDAWRAGDLGGARDGLSAMIAQGTDDARLYFYRGVLDERLGASGDADFQTGADLEAARSSTRIVNRALENTQGTLRSRIEKLRVAARDKYKADPKAASAKLDYRDALALRASGDFETVFAKDGVLLLRRSLPD